MKKKWLIFFFFLNLFVGEVMAQFDALFSQYMENQTATNPAAVGKGEMVNLAGIYRQQWAGFSEAPEDMFFSIDMPVSIAETKHGVGLTFLNDKIGLFTNQSVLFQYSYKIKLFDGVLGLGLNLGFLNQTFDRDGVDLTGNEGQLGEGDNYHTGNDSDALLDAISSEGNGVAFDAGVGCFFSNQKMYAGISVLHLTAPNVVDYLYVPRLFYLTSGYNILLSNTFYILKPSTQIRTDFSSFQIDLTCLLEYNKKIRGGISYRWEDAFVFMIGINLFSGLNLGYSYDLPTSKMIVSGGSHEISLRYSFKLEFAKKNKYKSERIL